MDRFFVLCNRTPECTSMSVCLLSLVLYSYSSARHRELTHHEVDVLGLQGSTEGMAVK